MGSDRDQGREARWHPHDGVAAHQHEGPTPARNREGKVECGDDPDHSKRVPLLHEPVIPPLRRDLSTVKLSGLSNREVTDVDHFLDLSTGFTEDLSVLEADQAGQVVLRPPEGVTQLAHHVAPLWSRHRPPPAESLKGCPDGARAIGFARAPNVRKDVSRRRITRLNHRAFPALNERAALGDAPLAAANPQLDL